MHWGIEADPCLPTGSTHYVKSLFSWPDVAGKTWRHGSTSKVLCKGHTQPLKCVLTVLAQGFHPGFWSWPGFSYSQQPGQHCPLSLPAELDIRGQVLWVWWSWKLWTGTNLINNFYFLINTSHLRTSSLRAQENSELKNVLCALWTLVRSTALQMVP